MSFVIRDVSDFELETVLALNQSEVPNVGSVDLERMRWYSEHAAYFRVAMLDGGIGAFLVGVRAGTSYESPNYRWFCDRYDDFAYVDRVAVAKHARRNGLAKRLYQDFAGSVRGAVKIMTCEVNVRPPNQTSFRFHKRLGFRRVGSLESEDGSKEVAMLLKDLDESSD